MTGAVQPDRSGPEARGTKNRDTHQVPATAQEKLDPPLTDPRYQDVESSPVVRRQLSAEQFWPSRPRSSSPTTHLPHPGSAVCYSPTLPAVSWGWQAQTWQVWDAMGLYAGKGLNLELQAKEPRPCLEPWLPGGSECQRGRPGPSLKPAVLVRRSVGLQGPRVAHRASCGLKGSCLVASIGSSWRTTCCLCFLWE